MNTTEERVEKPVENGSLAKTVNIFLAGVVVGLVTALALSGRCR